MIILGLDPGTANTGYGVIKKAEIKKNGRKVLFLKCLDYGIIKTYPTSTTGDRLRSLNEELGKLIKKFCPRILVVERLYFFKNLKTAIPVSQAEGVILLTAAQKKVPVCQFTPLQVKMAVTGYGWAEKKQVQEKMKKLLKLKEAPKPDDASDALAIALTYLLIKKG